jgi:hypothetical protein
MCTGSQDYWLLCDPEADHGPPLFDHVAYAVDSPRGCEIGPLVYGCPKAFGHIACHDGHEL